MHQGVEDMLVKKTLIFLPFDCLSRSDSAARISRVSRVRNLRAYQTSVPDVHSNAGHEGAFIESRWRQPGILTNVTTGAIDPASNPSQRPTT